ncbi:MAG: penicillin acylase family protein, partial [Chloroflexota bacterium]|nr:penicillin acylase family protein [Chloroflexota bacterium]
MARQGKGSKPRSVSTTGSNGKASRSIAGIGDSAPATNGVGSVTTESTTVTTTSPGRRRKLSLWRRILYGVAIVFVLLIAGVGGFIWYTVQKSQPTVNGSAQLKGLSGPVTVTRDTFGVPHIVAANISDLYAGEGYVHAQDRLFQMFLFRAVGEGRLSETFGGGQLDTDRFLRFVGFRRAAEAETKQLPADVRSALEAYSRGVNEFIHTHADSLPLEFGLQDIKMEDWQPVDTIAFGKLQAWDLSNSWSDDLLRSDVIAKVGAATAARLFPQYPQSGPFIVSNTSSGFALPALQAYNNKVKPWLLNMGLDGLGSNNWVVDGSKSTTGKPLLANDPHLAARNPSIWYQVHLSTSDGKYDAVGFSFAGAPGIITGHNQNIAWGVTNTGTDVQDVFLEKLDPAGHPAQYLSGDKWLPMQVITETFLVKGGDTVTNTVRITGHGPLLSDFVASAPVTSTPGISLNGQPYSMQWTAAKPGHLFEAVYGLQTASNWDQFRA